MDRRELTAKRKLLESCLKRGQRLWEGLQALPEFFSVENLRQIKRWAEHPYSGFSFNIEIGRWSVAIREDWKHFATFEIGEILLIPEAPEFGTR